MIEICTTYLPEVEDGSEVKMCSYCISYLRFVLVKTCRITILRLVSLVLEIIVGYIYSISYLRFVLFKKKNHHSNTGWFGSRSYRRTQMYSSQFPAIFCETSSSTHEATNY